MQHFATSPYALAASLVKNRGLITTLVVREVTSRYRGSLLGWIWPFITPLFMLLVYTFVFGVIFHSRWNNVTASRSDFALILFVGLTIFNLFSECVNRAPTLVLGNANYVKKVVFPLEILPWVALGAALFTWLVSTVVWLVFYIALVRAPHASAILLPFVILPCALVVTGLTWFLSSLGLYLRDVSQIITIITSVFMFLAPIFYPITAVSERYRYLLYLNPLTIPVEEARELLYWGTVPDLEIYAIYLLISVLFAWLGFAWFQKTRKGFADVL